jgi:hypothetical protein
MIRGKEFRGKSRDKKIQRFKISVFIDNTSEGGADYWLRILLDLSHAMILSSSTVSPAASLQLASACGGFFFDL